MREEKDKTDEPAQERKLWQIERLRRNPRFVVYGPRGESFTLGGRRAVPPKKPEG
jgi:hypothetical protein